MFGKFLGWLCSIVFAFSLGAGVSSRNTSTDSELKEKIQGHMDVIVDESAAIVDDIAEEARKDERVQDAEKFVDDVREIMDNTRKDIEDHFGETEMDETEVETGSWMDDSEVIPKDQEDTAD